mmetsp:Transcript_37951/g.62969  ORF Transcript_37951/g.62969 Transcript_37951/m.62969 type:complete len:217 (-) Transcript_37951:523-1173(-)
MSTKFLAAFIAVVFCVVAHAADPDPLSDFPPDVKSASDLKFNIFTSTVNASGPGGKIFRATGPAFPGVRTQGISATVVRFNTCGIAEPHHHPRATEIFYVISGRILVGVYNPANGEVWTNVLGPGDLTVFPRGSTHFQQNFANGPTEAFISFNSENPGSVFAANALSAFSNSTLGATIGVPASQAFAVKGLIDKTTLGLGSVARGTCLFAPPTQIP